MVNRSSREITIHAKWSSLDISELGNNDTEIAQLFDAGLPAFSNVPDPSSSDMKLFPLTNHMERLNGKRVALMYLYFYPISTVSSGGGGYTALEINNVIKDSTLVNSLAFNQTVIRNSQMVSHQPNWFRPKFVANSNMDYFDLDESSGEFPLTLPTSIYKPEFAQGLNLPFEENGQNKALRVFESLTSLDVYAGCYQKIKINSDYVFQQYIMNCEAKFIIID